jgi:hypothetical protein
LIGDDDDDDDDDDDGEDVDDADAFDLRCTLRLLLLIAFDKWIASNKAWLAPWPLNGDIG